MTHTIRMTSEVRRQYDAYIAKKPSDSYALLAGSFYNPFLITDIFFLPTHMPENATITRNNEFVYPNHDAINYVIDNILKSQGKYMLGLWRFTPESNNQPSMEEFEYYGKIIANDGYSHGWRYFLAPITTFTQTDKAQATAWILENGEQAFEAAKISFRDKPKQEFDKSRALSFAFRGAAFALLMGAMAWYATTKKWSPPDSPPESNWRILSLDAIDAQARDNPYNNRLVAFSKVIQKLAVPGTQFLYDDAGPEHAAFVCGKSGGILIIENAFPVQGDNRVILPENESIFSDQGNHIKSVNVADLAAAGAASETNPKDFRLNAIARVTMAGDSPTTTVTKILYGAPVLFGAEDMLKKYSTRICERPLRDSESNPLPATRTPG